MLHPSSHSYDEFDHPPQSAGGPHPLAAGLPKEWWPSVWVMVSLVFGIAWMGESWRTAGPLVGSTKINHLSQDLWGLLITLGFCYAIAQFWKHRSQAAGLALCLAVAAAAMTWHRL